MSHISLHSFRNEHVTIIKQNDFLRLPNWFQICNHVSTCLKQNPYCPEGKHIWDPPISLGYQIIKRGSDYTDLWDGENGFTLYLISGIVLIDVYCRVPEWKWAKQLNFVICLSHIMVHWRISKHFCMPKSVNLFEIF